MAITYPTTLDSFPNPTSTDLLENATAALDHDVQHSNANDAIEALEAKVGANSSAVTTSHDYKLSGVTGSDKAVSKTGTETLTNKTLTAPQINMGSDATGDMYYRTAGGAFARLPIGTSGQIIQTSVAGIPEWTANPSVSDASTTVKGVVEIATTSEITAGTSTGGTGAILVVPASAVGSVGASKIVQFNSSTQYPAADGSLITNIQAHKITRLAGGSPPDDTNENTVFTTTITGGIISSTGMIKTRTFFTLTSSATSGTYTIRLKYGGSTLSTLVVTTDAIGGGSSGRSCGFLESMIINNSSTSSQNVGFYLAMAPQDPDTNRVFPYVSTQPSDTTSTIDTTANQTLTVTVQKSNGSAGASDLFEQTIIETIKN